ncbi:MAG: DUF2784 domain-containing protein [Rubrivivax sp.]|nr:DUF2784 domain-containing protein [Rubrivivax sp.]
MPNVASNAWLAALLADALLVVHALFIAWVVLGALAVLRRAWLAWLHLPAAAWGVWIEWSGGICPLTPLETRLREAAGRAGYRGGFIEHHLAALIYPEGLTRELQIALGALVLVVNLALYGVVVGRCLRRRT